MRRGPWARCGILPVLAFGLVAGAGVAPAGAQSVVCTDPDGCPDLIVDQSRLANWKISRETFAPDDCAVIEGEVQAGSRRLLRFAFSTPNLGPGDLVIGDPADHPEWFDFATCHGHPHFLEYADYRLWTVEGYLAWDALRRANPDQLPGDLLAASPDLASQMVAGRKFGFCTVDSRPYLATAGPAQYTSCLDNQGISVGWADVYTRNLDGQWIDITDVPSGIYVLEGEVNAERFFEEVDYTNNRAAAIVRIPRRGR